MTNEAYIKRTFELARLAYGHTWPNPMVGCVIVKNGKIIAEGYHHKAGTDHAELDAIKNATESVEGSTFYVNLEPCCHTNKQTPPCAQRLIQERVKKVVIANLDPNPHVNGKGVQLLRDHGIEVEFGILEEEGEELNEVFFYNQRHKLPYVHLKMATTLDGKMSMPNGESQWITGELARKHAHGLRAAHQGVLIGAETLRKDNPKLNVRLPEYKGDHPYRIVLTKSGNLPQHSHLFTDELKEKTLIYQNQTLREVLEDLYQKKIINILIEGGAQIATAFMKEKLVNRLSLYMNPSILGTGPSALHDFGVTQLNARPHLKNLKHEWLGEDLYLTGRI